MLALWLMTGLGQSRRFDDVRVTSALPLIADLRRKDRHVRNVPISDIVYAVAATRSNCVGAQPSCVSWAISPRCDRAAQPAGCASSYPIPHAELLSRGGERHILCRRSVPDAADLYGDTVAPIPNSVPCASIHFHKLSVEIHRCARVAPLTLTTSAARPWP
jgi:hypothetical protein